MLLNLLSDAEKRKYLATIRSAEAEAVELFAESLSENNPASPRHQVASELRDVIGRDGWGSLSL